MSAYIVLGFIPDRDDEHEDDPAGPLRGVHTPLRQDGFYSKPTALAMAKEWRKKLMEPREKVSVFEVIDEA